MMAAGRAADGRGSKDAPTAARRERSSASAPAGAPGRGRRLAGRPRPVIEAVRPQVEGGRYPAKASLGELVVVEADVFADGHDELFVELTHRPGDHGAGATVAMTPLPDDRWRGTFAVEALGRHHFSIRAGVDHFATWRHDVAARAAAGQDVTVELEVGAGLVKAAARKAGPEDRPRLAALAEQLVRAPRGLESEVDATLARDLGAAGPSGAAPSLHDLLDAPGLAGLMARNRPPGPVAVSPDLTVRVERERARFGAWYELFPRSTVTPDVPGTLAGVVSRLDDVVRMGFDVVYLPPIHPIGVTSRKGRDGVPTAGPDDPGSPWAIGLGRGGHTAVHPDLGTIEDLDRLVAAARDRGLDIALDLAFQCSPDHPWVADHPEWFVHRPDGSIRYAENPPKRYEDIFPLNFDTPAWPELWEALRAVVEFWIGHGITVFRVDNPHTKPFAFWEWLIATVSDDHPEVIFLSEAFTRPKVMKRLAKLGFSQSYTYFAWRQGSAELEAYMSELVHTDVADYLRANLWPNTPDILTEELQTGGPPAFLCRLVLAATLGANYGIYGPPFELVEHVPRSAGSEEYKDSEKYAVRHWDLERPDSLAEFVARVNRIRRENPALHRDATLRFHHVDNPQLLCYSKTFLVEEPRYYGAGPAHAPRDPNTVLVVVNLDHRFVQSGWLQLDLGRLGLDPGQPFVVHDLLTDAHYRWADNPHYVQLDPDVVPAHIFRVHRPDDPAAPGGPR